MLLSFVGVFWVVDVFRFQKNENPRQRYGCLEAQILFQDFLLGDRKSFLFFLEGVLHWKDMPNHTNTWRCETTTVLFVMEKIWRKPNYKRDTTKRSKITQMPSCNWPCGQQSVWAAVGDCKRPLVHCHNSSFFWGRQTVLLQLLWWRLILWHFPPVFSSNPMVCRRQSGRIIYRYLLQIQKTNTK